MNGMRKFLAGGLSGVSSSIQPDSTSSPAPIIPVAPLATSSGKSSWPPSTPPPQSAGTVIARDLSESPTSVSPKSSFFRQDKPRPPLPQYATDDDPSNSSFQSLSRRDSTATSFTSSLSQSHSQISPSSSRVSPRKVIQVSRKPVKKHGGESNRISGLISTREDLLTSLLASEAVVDSRGFDILSSEQVEDLKKEHQVLTSRVAATTKKLALENKIRDAAISLSKVNSPYKSVTKQTSEQLENANRKVDLAQKELWRISERASDVYRQLLEHRAGVLSLAVRNMEKTQATTGVSYANVPSSSPDITVSKTDNSASPTGSPALTKFEHFFAGHADSVIPQAPKRPLSASDIADLEEQLQAAVQKLHAANKKQAEMARDLSLLKLEKEQVETSMEMELQTADETINALETEISRLGDLDAQVRVFHEEKRRWEVERVELESRRKEVETLERRLEVLEEKSAEIVELERLLDQKDRETFQLRQQWEADKARWEQDRSLEEKSVSARLDEVYDALQKLIRKHGVMQISQKTHPSISEQVESLSGHLERVAESRITMEEDLRSGIDKQEGLAQALEESRAEREDLRLEIGFLESQAREQSDRIAELVAQQTSTSASLVEYPGDAEKVVTALMPIWITLPSVEARTAKLGQNRFKSPASGSGPGTPMRPSLSELDVRSLKSMYDATKSGQPPLIAAGFTIEAFVARVQALISDDRALIERLLRFAQAHDLLKKNADRAQKLALESNLALETYQKQVKILEDRDAMMSERNAALVDELQALQETVDRLEADRRHLEMQAAEQAETCRQLTDANNGLSANTLSLAAEAASATDAVRRYLEGQLADCKAALQKAHDEISAMQNSEQMQRVALLEELNSMQTENSNLRAQLRNVQAKK